MKRLTLEGRARAESLFSRREKANAKAKKPLFAQKKANERVKNLFAQEKKQTQGRWMTT